MLLCVPLDAIRRIACSAAQALPFVSGTLARERGELAWVHVSFCFKRCRRGLDGSGKRLAIQGVTCALVPLADLQSPAFHLMRLSTKKMIINASR